MMPGRTRVHERPLDAAFQDRVNSGEHTADGQPGGVPGGQRPPALLAVPRPARARNTQPIEVLRSMDREQRFLGHRRGAWMRVSAPPQRAALNKLVHLRGQQRLRHIRGARHEVPARDLQRRRRWIMGEDPRPRYSVTRRATPPSDERQWRCAAGAKSHGGVCHRTERLAGPGECSGS